MNESSRSSEPTGESSLQRRRARAALANLFIGDALSMPVHWFYNPGDILRAFPPLGITQMEAAPERHPSSIMALHSTSRGGRGSQHSHDRRQVVGEVILKGRRHLWGRPHGHYHHGMTAGQNTLNAYWARLAMNFMTRAPTYDTSEWVGQYIDFMTADPPRHPDTYAESCHRGFFANLERGEDPLRCGAVTHDTPSMGALVTVAPIALALMTTLPLERVRELCRDHVRLTHPDEDLLLVVDTYVDLLAHLLERPDGDSDARPFIEASSVIPGARVGSLLEQDRGDAFVVGRTFSLACYITGSWPSVCYLAAKYRHDPGRALLANSNLGGENAHRGSVLGTLVGLASGDIEDTLYDTLADHEALDAEIGAWLDRFLPCPA